MDIELVGVNDFDQVRINRFDMLKGSYPGADQILLEGATRAHWAWRWGLKSSCGSSARSAI
jgi:hypothetical protein